MPRTQGNTGSAQLAITLTHRHALHTLSVGREHMWLTHGSCTGDWLHFSLNMCELPLMGPLRGGTQRALLNDTTEASASFFGRKTTRGDTIVNR
jgi:hypothetical protein